MPEIEGTPDRPSPSSPAAAPLAGDGSTTSIEDESTTSILRTTRPGTKRLTLTLSVVISFILILPFLLKSIEIHRSPLPFASIDSLSSQPPSFLYHFHLVFILHSPTALDPDKLSLSISDDIRGRTRGTLNFTASVTVDSDSGCRRGGDAAAWRCGAVDRSEFGGGDVAVDEVLDGVLRGEGYGEKAYTIVVVERGDEEVRVVVGKHRHAWMVGRVLEAEAVSMAGRVFVKYFVNGGKSEGEVEGMKEEFMPVGSDGSIVLSFSMLNANPNDWVYDWDYQKIDAMLAHIVEGLAPVANISIESQVLYYTPKSSLSYRDEKSKLGGNIFRQSDLPFFVNSNEWHLDTSIASGGRSKVLQFAVYVPSATECPLLLQLPNGDISKSNGFISPLWGGLVVWNPTNCSKDSQRTDMRRAIPDQDLHKIFQVFVGQLRLLFGFKSDYFDPNEDGLFNLLASESGFTEWELDVLYRHYACYNLISSATTLKSLSNLVQSLPRMIVMDEIGKQVKLSLDAATLSQENASLGLADASAVSSRNARALAEDAFFHPSLMSISYSSIEHYFAIYMPFFVPVLMHVLLAAIKEVKRFKKERAKNLAFVADQAKAS